MNRCTLLLTMAMLSILSAWSMAVERAAAILENRVLRLEIEQAPAPLVGRLVHKASGRVLVDKPTLKSLFSIVLAKPDGSGETIDSARAGQSSARYEKAAGGSKLLLRYENFPGLDLAVEVTATCDQDGPLTLWSIAVQNNTGRAIRRFASPNCWPCRRSARARTTAWSCRRCPAR